MFRTFKARCGHHLRAAAGAVMLATLAACGGGGGDGAAGEVAGVAEGTPSVPPTRAEALRFLTQATFGPTDADVDRAFPASASRKARIITGILITLSVFIGTSARSASVRPDGRCFA